MAAELLALLDRELVVSELALVGAKVTILRFEDGRLNVDDLLQGDGRTPQFDIGRDGHMATALVGVGDWRTGEVLTLLGGEVRGLDLQPGIKRARIGQAHAVEQGGQAGDAFRRDRLFHEADADFAGAVACGVLHVGRQQ